MVVQHCHNCQTVANLPGHPLAVPQVCVLWLTEARGPKGPRTNCKSSWQHDTSGQEIIGLWLVAARHLRDFPSYGPASFFVCCFTIFFCMILYSCWCLQVYVWFGIFQPLQCDRFRKKHLKCFRLLPATYVSHIRQICGSPQGINTFGVV